MKVVLLGCSKKGEILYRYVDDKYCECKSSRIGAEFKTKVEDFDEASVKLQVWSKLPC